MGKLQLIPKDDRAKTSKQDLKFVEIFNGAQSLDQRQNINNNIQCGPYVFDVAFYIKPSEEDSDDHNTLMITIEHKKIKRGTKRKASQIEQSGEQQRTKRRRLNDSQSQSYSINHSNGDVLANGDHSDRAQTPQIELLFTINITGPDPDDEPFSKQHKCIFGDEDWSHSPSIDSDEDSECDYNATICSFKTLTFQELSNRVEKYSDIESKAECAFSVWFELGLKARMNAHKMSRYDATNRVYKRPKFEKRRITKFVGLRNEGATCYMNSMLQTLYHIAALRRNVYKIPVGHEAEQKKKAELIEKIKKENEEKQQQKDNDNM